MIIQHRRGTTEEWRQADTLTEQAPEVLLRDGEFAIEECSDGTRRVKIGDGSNNFRALPYIDERAEIVLSNKLAAAKEVLTTKLNELDAAQKRLIANTKQELTQQITKQSDSLSSAFEANSANILIEAQQLIDTKVGAIRAEAEQNNKVVKESLNRIDNDLYRAESRLGGKIIAISNELNNKLATTAQELSDATDTKLFALEHSINKNLADSLIQHTEQNNSTFSEINTQLDALKEKAKNLGAANISLSTLITEVNNTLTATADQLSKKLYELTRKQEINYSTVLSDIEAKENDRILADTDIVAAMITYVSKIYAELADLVDDDILILEKAFSIENYLTSRINTTDAELAALAIKVHGITPGSLEATEARLNTRINELDTALSESLESTTTALNNRINNVKEVFDTIIYEKEADIKAYITKEDAIIADKLALINQELLEELKATKIEFSTSLCAIEQVISDKITSLVQDSSTASIELNAKIEATEKRLSEQITNTESTITTRIDDIELLKLVSLKNDLNDRIDSTERLLVNNIADTKTLLSNQIVNTDDKFSAELVEVNAELDKINTGLSKTITELAGTKIDLDSAKANLASTKVDLDITKDDLAETKTELAKTKTELIEADNAIIDEVGRISSELSADIDLAKQELTSSIAEAEQSLDEAIDALGERLTTVDERLSEVDTVTADRIAAVEESVITTEETLAISIADLATIVSADIENLRVSVDNKINELDVADPENTNSIDTNFINSIRQENGKIIATKAQLPVADANTLGITTLGIIGGAATFEQAIENADEISKLKLAISGGVHFIGITTSALFDESTINPITIDNTIYEVSIGDIVLYNEKEFIWTGSLWKELGDLTRVGALESWRDGLNLPDTSIASQFVTAVNQVDGKITVSRTQPTVADINYGNSSLEHEMSARANTFSELLSRSVQFNSSNNTLYVGDDTDDTIIFYCGTASDI